MIGGFRSGETNSSFKESHYLANDILKKLFVAKDPYEAKYQLLINKRECLGLKYFSVSKAFIEYSNYIDYVYKHIE